MEFVHVEKGPVIDEVRVLFQEYAESLHFSLRFQSFDRELAELPGDYAAPHGRLILCRIEGVAAGCIALKRLAADICEMKRLYVRPSFRGHGIGHALAARLIDEAREMGYVSMRLDTIAEAMPYAVALYRSLGFKEILPYYDNPISGAAFFELTLK
jgi:putative acetyltransferase